jgi:alpha-glucosidase
LDETKDYIRKLRAVLDGYPDRVMVAEPSNLGDASEYFGNGSDMFHMAFHFGFGYFWGLQFNSHTSKSISATFESSLADYPPGAQDALVIGSHDVQRAFAVAQGDETRHRRAAMIQLAMKGSPYVYYGEELGLRPGTEKVVDSRDSARTPMLWNAESGYGFTTATPWLAFGAAADTTNVAVEEPDQASMLAFYKDVLALRRGRPVWGTGEAAIIQTGNEAIFAVLRQDDFMAYFVAVNIADEAVDATFDKPSDARGPKRVFGDGTLSFDGSTAKLALPEKAGAIFRIR